MLIDVTTGNAQGFYPSEAAALADVAEDLRTNGRKSAEDLALVAPLRGQSLAGKALVEKALASQPQRKSA